MREFFKKLGTEYASKLFLVYWLRWMLSALVMSAFYGGFLLFQFSVVAQSFLGANHWSGDFFQVGQVDFF